MIFERLTGLLRRQPPARKQKPRTNRRLNVEPLESRQVLSLLGIAPQFPSITYDSGGSTAFNAGSHAFDVSASPTRFVLSSGAPLRFITTPRSFAIHAFVDNSGNLIGGASGDDLVVTGVLNNVNGNNYSGTLLTGEITGFGFQESGSSDIFDFRFQVTGGALAGYYAGKDIGVYLTSDLSSFNNSFATSFSGEAGGTLGGVAQASQDPVPEPHSILVWSMVTAGSLAAGWARRKKDA